MTWLLALILALVLVLALPQPQLRHGTATGTTTATTTALLLLPPPRPWLQPRRGPCAGPDAQKSGNCANQRDVLLEEVGTGDRHVATLGTCVGCALGTLRLDDTPAYRLTAHTHTK